MKGILNEIICKKPYNDSKAVAESSRRLIPITRDQYTSHTTVRTGLPGFANWDKLLQRFSDREIVVDKREVASLLKTLYRDGSPHHRAASNDPASHTGARPSIGLPMRNFHIPTGDLS